MSFTVGFDLTTDAGGALPGIDQLSRGIKDITASAKMFQTESTDAFNKSAKEVDGFTNDLLKGVKTTKQFNDELNKTGKTTEGIKSLKQQIRELTNEAVKLRAKGDIIGAEETIKKAGHLKDELKDIQDAIRAVSGNAKENLAAGFGAGTKIALQGFEGVVAIQGLVGEKSKEFEEQLIKLQALQSLTRIAGEFGDIGDRLTEIKLAFAPVKELYASANAAVLNWGKSSATTIGKVATENVGLFASMKTGVKDFVSAGISGFKSFFTFLAANPLIIFLTVIAAVVAAIVIFKEKMNLFAEAVKESITKSMKELETATKNSKSAIEAHIVVLEAELELLKAQDAPLGKILQKMKEIHAQRKQSMVLSLIESETKVFQSEREVRALEKEKAGWFDLLKLQILGISNTEERKKKLKELTDSLEQVKLESETIRSQIIAADVKFNADSEKTKKEALEKVRQNAEKLKQLQRSLAEGIIDIMKRADDAQFKLLSGEAAINKQAEIDQKEIDNLKKHLIEKGQELENFDAKIHHRKAKVFELSTKQQELFDVLEQDVKIRQSAALVALEASKQKQLIEQKLKDSKTNISIVEQEEAKAINAIEGMQNTAKIKEEKFQLQKELAVLEIQQDFAKKKLAVKLKNIEDERELNIQAKLAELTLLQDKNDAESEFQRELLLSNITQIKKDAAVTGEAAKNETDKALHDIEKSISDTKKKIKQGNKFNLAEALGLEDKDIDHIKSGLASFGQIVDSIIAIQQRALDRQIQGVENQIAATDKEIANREKNIQDLEGKLNKEGELSDKGLANNKNALRQQIVDEKAKISEQNDLREQQLAKEKELREKKKELARIQLITDSIVQGSNLVTAATEIYASVADAGPIGVALAVGAIALMIGSFIAQKAAALEAINSGDGQGFAEGVIDIQGPGTSKSDSINARLSKGESVMTAEETKENYSLFKGIRLRDNKMMHTGVLDLIKNTGIVLTPDIPRNLMVQREFIRTSEKSNSNEKIEARLDSLIKEQRAANEKHEAILKEQRHKIYTDPNGNLVQKMGSHTIVTRKKK